MKNEINSEVNNLLDHISRHDPITAVTILANVLVRAVISIDWHEGCPEDALEELIKDLRATMKRFQAGKANIQ